MHVSNKLQSFTRWRGELYTALTVSVHFPAFRLNTWGYRVSLRIKSERGKMQTRITPNTDTFYAVLESMWNSALREKFNFCFSRDFFWYGRDFCFGGKTKRWAIILWRLEIVLAFLNFLRSWVLSRSVTREAIRIYHVCK